MKSGLTVLLLLLLPVYAFAADVTLSWDPSPTADVAGYNVYYKQYTFELPLDGTEALEGPSPIDVGNQLTTTLTGLPDDRVFYIAVTAYDAAGYESFFSNIVSTQAMIALTRPGDSAIIDPTAVIFQWSFDIPGTTLDYTLFYGPDSEQVTTASLIGAPLPPVTFMPTGSSLLVIIVLLFLVTTTIPSRKYKTATLMFAFSLSLAACGGGGSSSSSSSSSTVPNNSVGSDVVTLPEGNDVATFQAVAAGTSDYHEEFSLQPGVTYYWKVVGVDTADPTQTYTSTVASFTTESF